MAGRIFLFMYSFILYVSSIPVPLSCIHLIDTGEDVPTPLRHRIDSLQVPDPIDHQRRRLVRLLLESGTTQIGADVRKHGVMTGHMKDE